MNMISSWIFHLRNRHHLPSLAHFDAILFHTRAMDKKVIQVRLNVCRENFKIFKKIPRFQTNKDVANPSVMFFFFSSLHSTTL